MTIPPSPVDSSSYFLDFTFDLAPLALGVLALGVLALVVLALVVFFPGAFFNRCRHGRKQLYLNNDDQSKKQAQNDARHNAGHEQAADRDT